MSHRCDACGKHVEEKDFSKGATYEVIGTGVSGDVFEIICIKCNDEFNKEVNAA
jgi:DNA-directed RNA polymerase subunit RPC12/RpoP